MSIFFIKCNTLKTHVLPIPLVVQGPVLIKCGQKEPHTYCLKPEDNKQEPKR